MASHTARTRSEPDDDMSTSLCGIVVGSRVAGPPVSLLGLPGELTITGLVAQTRPTLGYGRMVEGCRMRP